MKNNQVTLQHKGEAAYIRPISKQFTHKEAQLTEDGTLILGPMTDKNTVATYHVKELEHLTFVSGEQALLDLNQGGVVVVVSVLLEEGLTGEVVGDACLPVY